MSKGPESQERKSGSPFTPRGFTPKFEVESKSNGSDRDDSRKAQQFTNISSELTRNSNYVVSKLSATPLPLKSSSSSDLEGSIDESTGHGLLVSQNTIYTWAYNSVDGIPSTVQLPVIPSNNGFAPLALLVSPSAASTAPGVVVINTHTGHIRFYENIDNASSIGLLQHHKGISSLLKLYDREIITIAESIEPAGVLLSTNQGRLVLLSLRDSTGKPFIKCTEIIRRQLGFFSSSLDTSRQMIAIKPGAVLGLGERVAAVVTRGGDFQVWLSASDGQSKLVVQRNLMDLLLSYIVDLYPNAARGLEVLDIALLNNFVNEDVFLLLTTFENGPGEFFYILFTIRKEAENFSVFSAYKINTFSKPFEVKPQLHVPAPQNTAFVVFDNSIVLTELVTKLDHNLNLKRKWEDIIILRNDVNIIGSGAQDLVRNNGIVTQYPSVLAIVPEVGVLRVDKLEPKENDSSDAIAAPFLKSHIEQAVFYGEDSHNPIDFDLPDTLHLDSTQIQTDLLETGEEILISSSPYLPPRLLSIESHLELREHKLQKLLDYTAHNFKDQIDQNVKLLLIELLEKVTAAHTLHKIILRYSEDKQISSLFEEAIKRYTGLSRSSSQNSLFTTDLHDINKLLVEVIKHVNNLPSNETLAAEVISEVYSSVLAVEKKYRYEVFGLDGGQSGLQPFWFTSNEIYLLIDEVFQKVASISHSLKGDDAWKNKFVDMAEILFYQVQQKLVWMRNQTPKTREIQESIRKDQSFYEARSGVWTKTLVTLGAKAEALAIAETYNDLKSLVEISDTDRLEAKAEDIEAVNLRFDYYFNKFQYAFAETLYRHYIHTGNYQALVLEFQEYSEYLKRFFAENDYGQISWIKDILDSEYLKASRVLLEVSQKNNESLSDRSLQLSISKLSALASVNGDIKPETEDLLNDIQEELNFIEAQGSILDQIRDFLRSDSDPIAQIDEVVRDLVSETYNSRSFKLVKRSFERSLARLLSNKALTVNELVDLFTLLDGLKTKNKSNFYYALKVLHLSTLSESEKLINEKLIWRRAILSNDWQDIMKSENKSDTYIRNCIKSTFVFETLLNYFKDGLFVENNDYKVGLPDIKRLVELDSNQDLLKRFQFVAETEVAQLSKELQNEVDLLLELYSYGEFDEWIKALIGAANEESGLNKVINYNTMSIEN